MTTTDQSTYNKTIFINANYSSHQEAIEVKI